MTCPRCRSLSSCGPLLLALVFSVSLFAQDRPDLTGTWVVNRRLSDDPAKILGDTRRAGGGAIGALSRVARGISVFGIPIGSLPLPTGSSRSEEPDDLADLDYALDDVAELTVRQEATATRFEYGQAERLAYEPGVSARTRHGTATANWDGPAFTVEHRLDNGTKVVEVYSLDRADRLRWTVTVKAKRARAIVISRVYDRKQAGNEPSSGLNLAATNPAVR